MLFKGQEIGKPQPILIGLYIKEKNLSCKPNDVYKYWSKRKWKKKNGDSVKTLEVAINVFNGIFIKKENRKKLKQAKRRAIQPKKKKEEFVPYHKQLRDKQWYDFRQHVFNVKGRMCERCGKKTDLQIHHKYYKRNHKAWEYPLSAVEVLCSDCHAKEHNIKNYLL